MGPEQFAEACRAERDALLALYTDPNGRSAVGGHLVKAELSEIQKQHVHAALHDAVTDTLYTLLLALDGSAALGGQQQQFFRLADENGAPIASGDGGLEAAAYAALQES